MYIEHPYFYEGKYYANIDGEMIEITKEVAYAINNFYRSSKAKKVEIKNELGEVVDKMLREVPYSGQSIDGEGFMIEDFPDLNCDVEHSVLTKMEQQDIHKVIDQLNTEVVLCQDLVQVKMSFSHSNLPAIPKLPVDTIFQNHRVTYNRNDYEFVWYYKTFPSIQIPGGMHVCNC